MSRPAPTAARRVVGSDPGDEARIVAMLPTVRNIARRIGRVVPAAELDDLIGDGSVGLVRAVESYDPSRGITFESYARRLVLGAMLNGLRRSDPVSERVRRTLRNAERRRLETANRVGRLPSYAELERDDPALRRARTCLYRQTTLSIDAPSVAEPTVLADDSGEPSALLERAESRRRLAEAVALLPERQRRILALHYGNDVPLGHIGAEMRVSPQRVSQLHLAALASLRRSVPRERDAG